MAAENSFDIACKIDMQEVTNGLDQARREIATRYDLKGAKCDIKLEKTDITVTAPDDMKLKAVVHDQFENTVTMRFTKMAVNSGLPDRTFTFVAPKGVVIVPLK